MFRRTAAVFAAFVLCFLCLSASGAETSLTLPSGTVVIQKKAFYGDTSIENVVLPQHVRLVEPLAFAYSGLKTINLPLKLNSIAADAFEGCSVTATVCEGSYAHRWCRKNGVPCITEGSLYQGYVITLEDGLSVRTQAASQSAVMYRLPASTVLPYFRLEDGWYRVDYDNKDGYVAESMVLKVPAQIGYVKTTCDNVYVRPMPAGPSATAIVKNTGTILPCFGVKLVKGQEWFQVFSDKRLGYIRGDVAQPCDSSGADTARCQHQLEWIPLNERLHMGRCALCKAEAETAEHLASSCAEAGTCSLCAATVENMQLVLHANVDAFQSIMLADDEYHYEFCLNCEAAVARYPHERHCHETVCYNGPDAPACTQTNVVLHSYQYTDLGDGWHYAFCTQCKDLRKEQHSNQKSCTAISADDQCDGCGASGVAYAVRHYPLAIFHDDNAHWDICLECFRVVSDPIPHYTDSGDREGICSYCLKTYGNASQPF